MVALRGPESNSLEKINGATQTSDSFNVASLYNDTIEHLRRKLSLFVWQGFFEPLRPVSFESGVLKIAAPSAFHRDWIHDHYLLEIVEAARLASGFDLRVELSVDEQAAPRPNSSLSFEPKKITSRPRSQAKNSNVIPLHRPGTPTESTIPPPSSDLPKICLNPKNTFDSFVPGPSNQMAFAAATSIAQQPNSPYSPLFLFGPAGLGKTHLLHGIAHDATQRRPDLRIIYMSSEQWVSSYVQSIRNRSFDQFRRRFRNGCDILLIDDIQFLAGKEASQDEFFHTFNALHEAGKQIIVTSDKYPHEIPGLEERLQTRLSWGLIADIRPPEVETRVAILQKKAETSGIILRPEVAYFLATQAIGSVRELEGALLRLTAFSTITRKELTLSHAKEYLTPVFKKKNRGEMSATEIVSLVENYFDLKAGILASKMRIKQVSFARQVAIFLCRSILSMSLPELGRLFGGRDHSTILSSLRKIEGELKVNIETQTIVSRIEKKLLH